MCILSGAAANRSQSTCAESTSKRRRLEDDLRVARGERVGGL